MAAGSWFNLALLDLAGSFAAAAVLVRASCATVLVFEAGWTADLAGGLIGVERIDAVPRGGWTRRELLAASPVGT